MGESVAGEASLPGGRIKGNCWWWGDYGRNILSHFLYVSGCFTGVQKENSSKLILVFIFPEKAQHKLHGQEHQVSKNYFHALNLWIAPHPNPSICFGEESGEWAFNYFLTCGLGTLPQLPLPLLHPRNISFSPLLSLSCLFLFSFLLSHYHFLSSFWFSPHRVFKKTSSNGKVREPYPDGQVRG